MFFNFPRVLLYRGVQLDCSENMFDVDSDVSPHHEQEQSLRIILSLAIDTDCYTWLCCSAVYFAQ